MPCYRYCCRYCIVGIFRICFVTELVEMFVLTSFEILIVKLEGN